MNRAESCKCIKPSNFDNIIFYETGTIIKRTIEAFNIHLMQGEIL